MTRRPSPRGRPARDTARDTAQPAGRRGPRALRRIVRALALALAIPGAAAQAQDYLSQAEFVAIAQTNVLCYDASAAGDCAWAEAYHRIDATPNLSLRIGVMTAPGQLLAAEQEATWIADAICIRDGDLGVTQTFGSIGPIFHFDYRDHVAQPAAVTRQTIDLIAQDFLPKTCFRYARDPLDPARLVQHSFAEGLRQPGENRVVLIPFSRGFASLLLP